MEKFGTRVCMDVGHIRLRKEDIGRCATTYGPYLGHVHMHDVTYKLFGKRVTVMDDHQGLGTGIIDVDAVIQMLRAAHSTARWSWRCTVRTPSVRQDPEGGDREGP